MSRTAGEVCEQALRNCGALEPTERADGPELNAALKALHNLYTGWIHGGMFGRLSDVLVDADYEAGEWERITATEAVEILRPATIRDGSSVRAPLDGALVVICRGEPHEIWRYDGLKADWVSLHAVGPGDEAPLANIDADGLACCLAEKLAQQPGRAISEDCRRAARRFRATVSGRPASIKPSRTDPAITFESAQSFRGWGR